MASAYVALVSLMNVFHIIIHPKNPVYDHFDKSQIQSLFNKVNSLVDLLEIYSHWINKELEKKMTGAAFAVENMIEPYLMQIQKSRSAAGETCCPLISQELDKAIRKMDLIVQEAIQAKENHGEHSQLLCISLAPGVGSTLTHSDTLKIVGLEEETNLLIGQITSHQSNRQIIPIVGMGGLGKTTLVTNVYNHTSLRHHFDVKAWVTVSHVYTTRSIILPILHHIGVHGTDQMKDEELGEKLHKALFGRRYLIIIDDIWDVQSWNVMIRFCPDNNNGSRILLTTRILDVANRVSTCSPFNMQLLDVDRSWNLLSKMVFEKEVCPLELQNWGKEIAKDCKGLPLAIVVIGGLLKVSERTLEHWQHVARNIRSIIAMQDNEHCMKILSLSYHQLPIHLKPCFLYMATFPEDYKIKPSEVTKLWAADGFLKPRVDGKTLDEVALECLNDLISRKLVIVNERNKRGEMTCLTVHDLVRDLCIKESQKEKFLYVDDGVAKLPNSTESQRRLVLYGNGSHRISHYIRQIVFSRSFIWFRDQDLPAIMSEISLLRVIVSSNRNCGVVDNMPLVNLRFFKFSIEANHLMFLSSISWALNLETLIIKVSDDPNGYSLPIEIWNLWRLKHLIVKKPRALTLPDPPTGSDFVHRNFQTLKGVRVLSDVVLDRIPNIKILSIQYYHDTEIDQSPPCFDNFVRCQTLEVLCFKTSMRSSLESNYRFPSYLKRLTLKDTRIRWENMTIVGSLPNLGSLTLQYDSFIGEEWKSVEGEFEKLTFLRIDYCNDLVRWIVDDSSHFPSLEHLELGWVKKLEEIPWVFGELMTLVSINLLECSKSATLSAREILEEQQQGGNSDLTVNVWNWIRSSEYSVELEEELKGLPNDNFHLTIKKSTIVTQFNGLDGVMGSKSSKGNEFCDAMSGFLDWNGKPNLVDSFPFLKRVDPQGIRRNSGKYMGQFHGVIDGFVEERVQERKLQKGNGSKDFLDVLLEFDGIELPRKNVNTLIQEMFMAGTETSSATINWAIAELLRNPESLMKLRDEIDHVIGPSRSVEEDDINRLPYLQAVVKETMRLHPSLPLLLPRNVTQDIEYMGYHIPKETMVFLNVWAIHRDLDSWEDPLSFKPERFIGSNIDSRGRNFELLPFGAGRRICIGILLGDVMVSITLAKLVQTFDWKLPANASEQMLDMQEKMGISLRKLVPLEVIPVERNF